MDVELYRVLHVTGVWLSSVVVVFVALFLRHWYERRQLPVLKLRYDSEATGDNRYLSPRHANGNERKDQEKESREELWIRVRVDNTGKTNKKTAEDVELKLVSVQQERSSSQDNRPSWWFKVSNLNDISIDVPAGFKQYFDIAYVKNVVGSPDDLSFYLAVVRPDLLPWDEEKMRIESSDKYNTLEIGWKYTLTFALVSSNAGAEYYQMQIWVDSPRNTDPPRDKVMGEENLRKRVHGSDLKQIQIQ